MRTGMPLGMDEIMIVNPGPLSPAALFLGEDGVVYQVQGVDEPEERGALGQFFLGEDGGLYEVQAFAPAWKLGDIQFHEGVLPHWLLEGLSILLIAVIVLPWIYRKWQSRQKPPALRNPETVHHHSHAH